MYNFKQCNTVVLLSRDPSKIASYKKHLRNMLHYENHLNIIVFTLSKRLNAL